MKNQKGITLIALAITIAIMIILAAVTIRVSLKGGLFGTAKEATGIKQIAQEKEQLLVSAIRSKGRDGRIDFAALDDDLPDGFSKVGEGIYISEVGNKYEVTEDGAVILLEQNGEDGLEPTTCAHTNTKIENTVSATCTINGHTGRTICAECGKVLSNGNVIAALGHTTTDGVCDNCNQIIASTNIIPANGTYYVGVPTENNLGDYTGATTILTAGEEFPTINMGDIYVYGDYEYRYNMYGWLEENWYESSTQNGWGVSVLDNTKYTYGNILENINGKPVTNLDSTFAVCKSLTSAPVIPNSVTSMDNTFLACIELTTPPVIPNGVKDMGFTFEECQSLIVAPIIPNSVTNMKYTFYGCSALKKYIGSFDGDYDFSNYIIPNSVTNMNSTFEYTSITRAPTIPNSVTDIGSIFCECKYLEGTIVINANPSVYSNALQLELIATTGKNITLTGTSSMLSSIAKTSSSGSRIVYDINGNILKQ